MYILHQGGIVFPGWFLIQLDAPIIVKYPLLLITAVTVTVLTYHFIVRPLNPLRFLFGMKPRKLKPAPQLIPAAGPDISK
ncbi:MAG: hypothetical protein NTZ09_00755 [Candidatus Hydrogenedentes bacterium]|nr:hypothetical protein [Candidatus Hydrogenedentota bacterium]